MSKVFSSIFATFKKIARSKIVIGIVVLFALITGGYFLFFHHTTKYQFITVESGSITQSVSLTGNTTPTQSVALSFSSSGIISHTYSDLGKAVHAGQVLAELNTNDLTAQLRQAQANVDTQQAKLQGLQNGSRPEDITLAQVGLANAKTDLENTQEEQSTLVSNAYRTLLNSTLIAYPITNGNTTGAPSTISPIVSGTYSGNTEGIITIQTVGGGQGYFNASGLVSATGSISATAVPIGTSGLYLSFPSSSSASSGTGWTIPIPNTQANNYITNLNIYNSALTTQSTTIAEKQATVAQEQAQLDIQNSGSSTTDISSQQAQVEQAQASVASAQAKLQNAQIVAPIAGTVTQFDAKVGQLASISMPLVSIMSGGLYEVDAGVSEIDVAKVSVGDKVAMTLDAFPNETLTGSVFYIAPAETNIGGVISYQIKISFDKSDSRLKSGLTANIDIQTEHKDNVLVLPEYAILQNDQGTFVETLENNKIKQNPVTLGIQDQTGNVEIVSGVTANEQVLNIGLKS